MTIATTLRKYLLTKTEITAEVGSLGVVIGIQPPEQIQRPHIAIETVDAPHDHTIDGTACDKQFSLFLAEIRSDTDLALETVHDLVWRSLQEIENGATTGTTTGDVAIQSVLIVDRGTDEPPVTVSRDGGTSPILRRPRIFRVAHTVSPAALT